MALLGRLLLLLRKTSDNCRVASSSLLLPPSNPLNPSSSCHRPGLRS